MATISLITLPPSDPGSVINTLLDEQEPEDMDSEEYESWGDRHEALEDLADEILDRLDELGGRL